MVKQESSSHDSDHQTQHYFDSSITIHKIKGTPNYLVGVLTNDEVINNTSMVVRKSISYEISRHLLLFSFNNTLVTNT